MKNKPNGIENFFNIFTKGMNTMQGCLSILFTVLFVFTLILTFAGKWITDYFHPETPKNPSAIFTEFSSQESQHPSISSPVIAMNISSTVFADNALIPSQYTCDGQSMSPPLQISQVPAEAKSLSLIVHDPDAPAAGGFTHWVVWNIPPQTTEIPENSLPAGAVQGRNGTGKSQWTAPYPPSGTHHYQFMLYALDTVLNIPSSTDKSGLEKAMQGHILAQNTLVGLYQRK